MACSQGAATHSVIEALRRYPERFDFFQALRLIECHYAEQPRLGTGKMVSDDPIRLGQEPEMDFAPSTLTSFKPGRSGIDRLTVRFLGLFGPNGPLPLHLTEYARQRLHHHGDSTLVAFADIFHHRMLCLFYRAWASSQPTVMRDRPDAARDGFYVGALLGLASESMRDRDAVNDLAKLHYAGLLSAQTRHPDGLASLLGDYFGYSVVVEEYVGEWMEIAIADQSRLGSSPRLATLGQSTVVGARVWGCQHKFRLAIGPLDLPAYRRLLPGGTELKELVALVRNYAGDELAWDVNLALKGCDIPSTTLDGDTQLGWTSWLGDRRGAIDAKDLMLNPFFSRQH
jgi:type VI secretion system protein ImpH